MRPTRSATGRASFEQLFAYARLPFLPGRMLFVNLFRLPSSSRGLACPALPGSQSVHLFARNTADDVVF